MTKRVTIVLADDIDKKLRNIQAKRISQSTISISFSRVINDELRKSIGGKSKSQK